MDNRIHECPFCRKTTLLKGDIIHSTEHAYLIENTFRPRNFLIVPEVHATDIQQLPDTWWADVKVLLGAVPGLGSDYNVSLNVGASAGQTQPHLYFWVVPRAANSAVSGKGLVGLMELLEDRQDKWEVS